MGRTIDPMPAARALEPRPRWLRTLVAAAAFALVATAAVALVATAAVALVALVYQWFQPPGTRLSRARAAAESVCGAAFRDRLAWTDDAEPYLSIAGCELDGPDGSHGSRVHLATDDGALIYYDVTIADDTDDPSDQRVKALAAVAPLLDDAERAIARRELAHDHEPNAEFTIHNLLIRGGTWIANPAVSKQRLAQIRITFPPYR